MTVEPGREAPDFELKDQQGNLNDALGCANRATFLIDKDGKVVDTFATDNIATPREKARYADPLTKL
jgi:peroxiredoxin